MDLEDVERIIHSIKQGDQDAILAQLQKYNDEVLGLQPRDRVFRSLCQPRILKVCLRTLRILSRDRQALGPLLADSALLTLARLGGISALPQSEVDMEESEVWRKEAMKTLCNIVYNSHWAQERASVLGLLSGLSDRLVQGIHTLAPPCGQFYELRLIFLLTALRPELRAQLQKVIEMLIWGVSLLTTALEQCLLVQWKGDHHVLLDHTLPPVSLERSQCAIEILKILFNISCCIRTTLYRHLAAILRHCMLLSCATQERTEELQSHTVNLLSALPLEYLDVLLSVPPSEGSLEWEGFNMDCVHSLLLFMERHLRRNDKLKERLTPVLNLLTESCRVHRETRHWLCVMNNRWSILPPLRDVATRPEQGETVKSRLVRLMTHVDTDVKHCAAELLFVLCKENVSRFVKYTGYGNAAGLLAARGLLGARGMLGVLVHGTSGRYSSDSDSETDEYRQAKGRINLVTGRVEDNQADPMEGMTEEEKEEEARKLFHMFRITILYGCQCKHNVHHLTAEQLNQISLKNIENTLKY
uniref:Synembryn n=1 Tax=Paramormyrops kingsleyae TaxID=1676925 RepID=A0A3B3RT40_9TELE